MLGVCSRTIGSNRYARDVGERVRDSPSSADAWRGSPQHGHDPACFVAADAERGYACQKCSGKAHRGNRHRGGARRRST